jgi:hypothetical protein
VVARADPLGARVVLVYQHLGNLPAEELAADRDYREVLAAEGDTWPLLAALADRADAETDGSKGVRFSFRWDLGTSRFVMVDSRNGRILDGGAHLMLGETEFAWVEEQVRDRSSGPVDHLVLGTSLPWLLPHAIGDLQSINQLAAARRGWRGRLGERIRQVGDLEHWQAFRSSFDRLTAVITEAATGPDAPASIDVLSGDVHHSYAAQVDLPGPGDDPGRDASAVVPADLLAGAQRRRLVHPARVPARLVADHRARHPSVGRARGCAATRGGVAQLTGPLFGNTVATWIWTATRRGHVPAAAVGGHGARGRPAGADRRPRAESTPDVRCVTGRHRQVVPESE